MALNLKAGARRVKIDPATQDMRDPHRLHMPSDASCIGRDGVSLVNHEIKVRVAGRNKNTFYVNNLSVESNVSKIKSHIVMVFGFFSYVELRAAISEILYYMQNPTLATPVLDKFRVFWGRISALLAKPMKHKGAGSAPNCTLGDNVKRGILPYFPASSLEHHTTFGRMDVGKMGTVVPRVRWTHPSPPVTV
jgi:hypothetical protein